MSDKGRVIKVPPVEDESIWQTRARTAEATIEHLMGKRFLETDSPVVIDIMGSAPECAEKGCQYRKLAPPAGVPRPHRVTPPMLRGEPEPGVCCSGCGLRLALPEGFIFAGVVHLCGDCWRKAQPILHVAPPAGVQEQQDDPRHASAKPGWKCGDCTLDGEPCPLCYAAWWKRRHPNVEQLPPAGVSTPLRARLIELIEQVSSNQKHERHRTYKETSYWCQQWRLLAEQLAAAIQSEK